MFPWTDPNCVYFPILHVTPTDQNALKFLPNSDGPLLCPIFPLGPWGASKTFEKTVDRVRDTVSGKRPNFIVDLADSIDPPSGIDRMVHRELRALAQPERGFANWCNFIAEQPDMVPVVQLRAGASAENVRRQIDRLVGLGRGIVVRLKLSAQEYGRNVGPINFARALAGVPEIYENMLLILDFQTLREELVAATVASEIVNQCAPQGAQLPVVIASTSFPEGFASTSGFGRQLILERRLVRVVADGVRVPQARIIYGDYGSARVREGGGGRSDTIPARVDYACRHDWHFYRVDGEPRTPNSYQAAAASIRGSEFFVEDLNIFGNNVIKEASEGQTEFIDSLTKAATVRMNIHMHRQAHYSSSDEAFLNSSGDEDEWED